MTTGHLDSARDIATAVRSGRLNAVDVVRAHLERIAVLDDQLGAFRSVRWDRALAEAATVDERGDRRDLALAGVPVAVKDNIAVAGEQVRHGSSATSPATAEHDDQLVARLRQAGAIVIGISRMPELAAWAFTSSAAHGVTRNPWDVSLDPGGSTGGGAVAVATGMAAIAFGTDGGGSLRVPAAYCGLVGLKPGLQVLPLPGGLPEHWCGLSVAGPIARTADDARLALSVLRGSPPAVDRGPRGSLRVAVSLRSPVPTGRPDAQQRAAVDAAVTMLQAAGHEVVRADPPYPSMLIQRWSRRWWAGIALDAQMLQVAEADLEPRTRTMIAKGRRVLRAGGPRPRVAAGWRTTFTRWLEDYDLLLTPTVARGPAPAGAFTGRRYLPTYLAAGRSVPFCQAWNLAGVPAVAVPVGLRSGCPLSVQLVGPPDSEDLLLDVAAQISEPLRPPILRVPESTSKGRSS